MRLRYFGPRPLTEYNEHRSSSTILLSANAGYRFNGTCTLTAEVLNLLDRRDSEIDYWYACRLPGEPAAGVADRHFHPVDPLSSGWRWRRSSGGVTG